MVDTAPAAAATGDATRTGMHAGRLQARKGESESRDSTVDNR